MSNSDATPAGKVLPQNLDAEKSLLGAILVSPDALDDATEHVVATDFYDPRHQGIFAAMIDLFNRHQPVDLLTVTNELRGLKTLAKVGGAAYLSELTTHVPTAAHAAAYAKIVADTAVRRRLIKASADISALSFDESAGVEELLGQAEKQLFSVSDQNQQTDMVLLEHILAESFDRIENLHKNKGALRGLKTGFHDLDRMTAGLQKSDLIIIAARPAMGKTTLATNLAFNVATINRKGVLVFSQEMSKEQIVDRMLADASGIDSWNIRTGNLGADDFTRLTEAMGEMSEAPIYIDDTPGMSVLQMRTKARRAAHQHGIGLIVIDYLQLMSGNSLRADNNRVQEVSEISRGLKLMARELDVPVIALSQLSRAVESRTPPIPMLSDLRESGSIEQDADIVMFIYREDYYNPETERQRITDLIIAKHRNGPVGKVELYFDPERLRFVSLKRDQS
ncbi:replicative DNA helicase [Candidatus Saccharibacteria bacterium]|nr:replicative DNA helicase [Candidatus Saccharibacteria bacterium]